MIITFDLFKKEEIKTLKVRMAELEEENRKLSLLLEKRDEKTKKTVATKQEVDRELNEARKRISDLENELKKFKKEIKSELSFCFSENLTGNKLEGILFLLDSMQSKISTLITLYLEKDGTLGNVPEDVVSLIDSPAKRLIEKIESSTGKVIFYDTERIVRLVMLPAYPVQRSEYAIDRRFKTEPLKNCLKSDKTLVINAHAGETFIGIVEADSFVEHGIIRSSVMGKHSKGGWSQKRFQSLVEEDVKHHADKVRDALLPMIDKNKDLQYIIAGGEEKLIKMILEGYEYPVIIRSIDPQDLNQQQVLKEAMSVRLYGI